MKKLSLLILSMMISFFLTAQTPGTLNYFFGDDGIVLTDYDNVNNYSYASVLQEDNKKIVLGGVTSYSGIAGTVFNIMVTRHNSGGTIDMGFGTEGIKVLEFGGSDDYLTDIAIQADGKIVGVGHTTMNNKTKMLAFRLNTDGSLDNSFNVSGMTTIDFGENVNAFGMSLGICDDGKIVISGYVRDSPLLTYSEIAMCKLMPNGILDIDFGYFGLVTYEELDLFCFPDELIIHNDRIILGGVYLNADFERRAVISGYHLNGDVDYSFGNLGYTHAMLEGGAIMMGAAMRNGMCVAPDGKILYTVNKREWTASDFGLLRLNANGGIDYSFGTNGILYHEMDENSYANDVITQADGKIIACGSYRSPEPGSYDFLIMRFLENGDLDTDFGSDGTGIVITHLSTEVQWYADMSYNLMFCNGDKLLVSGYGRTIAGEEDFAMACYHTGVNVGISKHEATEIDLSIHPNPAQNQIQINIPPGKEITEVSIYNQLGQQLIHQQDKASKIDISALSPGFYEVEVWMGNTRTVESFIKSQ